MVGYINALAKEERVGRRGGDKNIKFLDFGFERRKVAGFFFLMLWKEPGGLYQSTSNRRKRNAARGRRLRSFFGSARKQNLGSRKGRGR